MEMPKRERALKFQCSIPMSATKDSKKRFQQVVDAAASHLRALAGAAATAVEIRAEYQDRVSEFMTWRDILVVCVFNGPLNETTRRMQIERNAFEFKKTTGKEASPLSMGGNPGAKVLLQ